MEYKKIQNNFLKRFNELFWLDHGKWKGYCNYSIREDEKGQIRYGDLGAQIWPLFVKAASLKQAEAVRKNLKEYYAGDIGLATTSERLKKGSSIPSTPKGGWVFQWEVNCWPPLMYVAIEGLKNYSKDPSDDFAKDALLYQTHWIKRQIQDIQNSGSLYEKSPYHSKQKVDGGYYGTLKGFGWTVGTFLSFAKDLSGNYSFFNHKKNHGAATDT